MDVSALWVINSTHLCSTGFTAWLIISISVVKGISYIYIISYIFNELN